MPPANASVTPTFVDATRTMHHTGFDERISNAYAGEAKRAGHDGEIVSAPPAEHSGIEYTLMSEQGVCRK